MISALKLAPKAYYKSMLNGKIEPNEASTSKIIDSDMVNININKNFFDFIVKSLILNLILQLALKKL